MFGIITEDDKVLPDGCDYTGGFTNDKNCTHVSIVMLMMTSLTLMLMIKSLTLMLMTLTRSELSVAIQFSDMLEATGVYRQSQPGPRATTYRSDTSC